MKSLLKNFRENKKLKTREVAQLLGIDQALISKFENGTRKPTKDQIARLASLLEIDYETIITLWLKEKIIAEIGTHEFGLIALKMAEDEIKYLNNSVSNKTSLKHQQILVEIDQLKFKINKLNPSIRDKIEKRLELEYTFQSNQLEGNTLSFNEMEMVVNKGMTISGKSLKEHLEIINHQEAIMYIKNQKDKSSFFNEAKLLSLHSILYRGIPNTDAGQYKKNTKNEVTVTSSQLISIDKQIEELFIWFESHKNNVNPIDLVSQIYIKLISIEPFSHGTNKIANLISNLILLQNEGVIMTISDCDKDTLIHESLTEKLAHAQKEKLLHYLNLVTLNKEI